MKRHQAIILALLLAFSCKAERAVQTDAAMSSTVRLAQSEVKAPAMPRVIIRNAQLTLVVGDAAPIVDKLSLLAGSFGGYVSDAKQWRETEQLRATITLRVPAEHMDQVLAAARKLARRVESENLDANDATQEYVDLDSQVRNLEATETEMRALMTDVRARMKKSEDILEIYQHLTQLRGQIEQAKGRMRYLGQLSAMATIKIDLVPDAIAKPVVEQGWQALAIARDASRSLVRTLEAVATALIWCGIYLLPVVLLFALAALAVRVVVRAMRRRWTV
jgi:hypothetical protein